MATNKNKKTSNKKNMVKAEKITKEEKALESLKEKVKDTEEAKKKVNDATADIKEKLNEKIFKKADAKRNAMMFKYNRVLCYLFDVLFVVTLAILLCNNTITNPYYGKEAEPYNEFVEIYNEVKDEVNEDGVVTTEELLMVVDKIAPSYRRYCIRSNVALFGWFVVLYFFYFGFFAYLNNGQTLFNKIYKLRVVDKNGSKPTLFQMLRRCLFGGNKLLTTLNVPTMIIVLLLMLLVKNGSVFIYAYVINTLLCIVIDIVFIVLFVFKKNGRTLNDLVGGTKVIEVSSKK